MPVAAARGHEAVVKLLLDRGANIESSNRGMRTALLEAVEQQNEAVVRLLVKRGADVNQPDLTNTTPLSSALRLSNKAIAMLCCSWQRSKERDLMRCSNVEGHYLCL